MSEVDSVALDLKVGLSNASDALRFVERCCQALNEAGMEDSYLATRVKTVMNLAEDTIHAFGQMQNELKVRGEE